MSRESVRSEIIQWIADNLRLSSSLSEKVQRILADLHAYKDVVSNVLTDLKDDADKFAKFQRRLQEKQPELHVRINFDEETRDSVGYRGDIENLLVESLCFEVLKWTSNELLESPLSNMVKKALEDFQSLKDNCQNVVFNALRELEDDAAFRCRLQEEQPELYDEFFGSVSTPESDESFAGIPPTDDDKSLVQFFNLMIGDKKEVELDNHLLIVESRSYTAEVLLDCYDRCKGKGLARELLLFMVDLLKRQQSLAALTDSETMAEASEKLECLPPEYFEWSHKDMFIALLEITPPSLHSRLVSLAVRIGCCAPFIYRRILPNGNVAMRLLLDGCRKVLDAKSNPLVLSCGTASTVNRGKTDLIGELFGLGASSQSRARGLSLHSSSPCHNLSVDLLFNASLASGASVVLADAHGFSSESFGFSTALGMLMSVASTTVIHVSKSDFTELGEANDDVKNYCDCFIKNNDQFGKAMGSCLVLVWRDYEDKDEKQFESVKVWLERQKQDGVSLKLAKIANLKEARPFVRQQSLKKFRNVFFETMTSHDKKTLPASCQTAEMVCRLNAIAKINPLYRGTQEDTYVPLYTVRRKTLVKIESRTRAFLDEIVCFSGSDKLSRSLFPVLTLKAEHAQLEEKKRHLAAYGDVNAENFSVQLSDLEELIKKKEELMSAKETSSFVKDFASFVLKGDLEAIDVIEQTLAKWIMFKCSPLLSECDTLKKRIDELEVDGQDKDVKAIKNNLAKIEETISAFNVSIHDVWGELISLAGVDLKDEYHRTIYRLETECHLPRERLAQTYRDWIIQGNPMQLLRGSPLYMASEFISSILRLFQEGSDRRVFVISVIGMQSSAKSTLLNYLFGCGFETGVGRCTRGLYASYMRTNELDLLILDFEGLMAVEGEGRNFDNEITLMAMACSHAVIINHKGELARQLQELFEVAVFAMNRLEVIRVRPDVLFVLRDQIERGKSAAGSLQSQLTKMLQNIKATAEKLKVEVNRYLNLHSLTLLPVAFQTEERKFHLPSLVFSNECVVLRKKTLDLYRKKFKHHGDSSVEEFSSLQQWSVHARCVWTTIKTFGPNLLQFDNMQQIEERVEAASVFAHVVAIHIENRGGYLDECRKLLKTYLKMQVASQSHLVALGTTYMAELLSRRKLCEENADKRLSSALKGKQYLYDQYSQRLTSRINEITKHCMRGWQRHEMFMKEYVISAELVGKMDRRMREQNMKSVMSVRELRTALNQEWNPHVDEIQGNSWNKSKEEIFQEVLITLADHRLENINDSVFGVVTLIPKLPSRQSLATSKNADHFKSFLCGKTSVQSKIPLVKFNEDQRKKEAADWLKNKVCAFFEEFRTEKKEDCELELVRAFLVEVITKTRDVILLLNKQLEENFGLTAKMPTLVSDMFNCLVFETVNMLHVLQKQEEEIGVEVRRESICQKHLLLLESNRDDLQFAKAVVYDIQSGLMNFCQTKVIDIVINIDKDLRKMLPNWSTTVSIAFEESFIKGNWRSVLAFCEDASAFIRDLVYERFRCLKDAAFTGEFSVALKKISNEMALLTEIMSDWGKANKGRRKTSHLIKFGRQRIQRLTGETVDILDFIPSYLHATDPHLFSAAFGSHVKECLLCTPITHIFEDMFEKELSAAKEKFWEDLEGCSEQCPLCSAPCDHQDKAHLQHGIKHGCQIHFLPAFHGSRNPTTKEPIFLFCSTVKERKVPLQTCDVGPIKADKLLNTLLKDWGITHTYVNATHLLTLRRAWVKCRKPILQMKYMVDSTPKEWIRLFGGGNAELKADDSKLNNLGSAHFEAESRRLGAEKTEITTQLHAERQSFQSQRQAMLELAARCRDLQEQVERQNAHFQAETRSLVAEKFEKETQCQALQAQCETLETERTHLHAERQALESRCQALKSQLQTLQDSFDNRNVVPIPYEKATIVKIGDSYVPLHRISPVVSKELTPKGIDMTIAENKGFLSIPPGAVDDPILVSSCLLSDNGKYKRETGVALTEVVQLLPHGKKLRKAATLKLKHNLAFRKNHGIKVTLLYQSGTDSKKVFRPLCVLTALNQVVSFRFGYAILVVDKIIVKTTSFCYICGENNGCCIKLSEMVFARTDLTPSQFQHGFAVTLCICEASKEKEDQVIERECKRSPYEVKMLRSRDFSLCDCGSSKDKGLSIVARIDDFQPAAGWNIRGSYKVDFCKLRAIYKGDREYEPYYFSVGVCDKSHDVSDTVAVWFTIEWNEETIKLLATFRAKNVISPPSESVLDRMVTEEELNKVAKYFPDDWKDLARELKVDVKKVEAALKHEPREHPHNMLKLWIHRDGTAATVRLLCRALLDVEHRLAAEVVFPDAFKRLLRESTTSQPS